MTWSLTGEANEFLINGLGVICIDMKYLPDDLSAARGLACEQSSFYLLTVGIDALGVPLISIEVSFSKVAPLAYDLQIVVLTIKLPETDFVFVIERAARKNTLDFEKFFLFWSLVSTIVEMDDGLQKLIEPGFALKGLL